MRSQCWSRGSAILFLVIACLWSVLSPSVAFATTFYVSPSGSGTTCSLASPCGAIATGVGKLSAGDTLYLRGGTYGETVGSSAITFPSGTSWSNAITIAGYPGEVVTISTGINIQDNADSSVVAYMIFDNLTLRNTGNPAFRVAAGSHHIRLSNSDLQTFGTSGSANVVVIADTTDAHEVLYCAIHDAPVAFDFGATTAHYGMYVLGNHMLIDGNIINNNTGYAIHLYKSGGSVNNAIIRNNIMYGNGYDDGARNLTVGVVILAGSNNLFYNNILYSNNTLHGGAIVSSSNGSGNKIYNNTIYNNGAPAIEVNVNAPGTIIINNIVYNNGAGIVDYGAAGTQQSNNSTTNPVFAQVFLPVFARQAHHRTPELEGRQVSPILALDACRPPCFRPFVTPAARASTTILPINVMLLSH